MDDGDWLRSWNRVRVIWMISVCRRVLLHGWDSKLRRGMVRMLVGVLFVAVVVKVGVGHVGRVLDMLVWRRIEMRRTTNRRGVDGRAVLRVV